MMARPALKVEPEPIVLANGVAIEVDTHPERNEVELRARGPVRAVVDVSRGGVVTVTLHPVAEDEE